MAVHVKSHSLPLDADDRPVQVASRFTTTDATAITPLTSPMAMVDTATLTSPTDAIICWVKPSAVTKISDDATLTRYANFTADAWAPIPCTAMPLIYLGSAGNTTVQFYFEQIGKA